MRATSRMIAALALVLATQAPAHAGGRLRSLLRLADRGPRAGAPHAHAHPRPVGVPGWSGAAPERLASYDAEAAAPQAAAPQAAAQGGDPYGFLPLLNGYRASAGLPPVAFDADLAAWASRNNAAQCRRGLGHHVNPNCYQNCAGDFAGAAHVMQGWVASPGHRANLLEPSIRRVGIAYGPGPYWTLNAR